MASDEAAKAYMEKTPKDDQTASGVWDAMTLASDNMVEAIKKKDFTKYLAIANPKNGDDFLGEVRLSSHLPQLHRLHATITRLICVVMSCLRPRSIGISVNSQNQR